MSDGILRKSTKMLQKEVLLLLKEVRDLHKVAKKSVTQKNKKLALQVFHTSKSVRVHYTNILDLVTFIFAKRPLATELRRVIGYMQVSKELLQISGSAVTIAKFVLSVGQTISLSSQRKIIKIHDLFYKSLLKLKNLISEENAFEALTLAKKDQKIDVLREEIVKSIIGSITKKTQVAEVDQRVFVCKLVNAIERSGDQVVHICEAIIYIKSGHFHGLA